MTRARVLTSLVVVSLLEFTPSAFARQSHRSKRIHLIPHYSTGQVLRYDVQLQTKTMAHAVGPIVDPEGATKFDQSVNVILRLDVLSAARAADGPVRLRATYERVTASSKSNSYDPAAEELEKQYERLQGRSIEFSLHPDGKISDISGLQDVAVNPARAAEMNQWMSQITIGASVPRKGIAIGEKWSSVEPLSGAPLAGVSWRTKSTYQSDEPCNVSGPKIDSAAVAKNPPVSDSAPDECAVILTRSEMRESRGRGDRTPIEYKKNGLRTSGEWKGAGESLTAISLRSGLVISVTQSGTTHMDFTVTAAATGNQVHYTADTQSQAQITLLPESQSK